MSCAPPAARCTRSAARCSRPLSTCAAAYLARHPTRSRCVLLVAGSNSSKQCGYEQRTRHGSSAFLAPGALPLDQYPVEVSGSLPITRVGVTVPGDENATIDDSDKVEKVPLNSESWSVDADDRAERVGELGDLPLLVDL